jgi:hypothetical protein
MKKMKAGRIPFAVDAFRKARRVAGFFGVPGSGKTALVREGAEQISRRLSAPVVVEELHLASMSEVDVRGFLIPEGNHSRFTKPPFWEAVESSPNGILFLDEFPQAPHEVQKAVAPLLLDRRVGNHTLPDGWSVVVAGNRLEDNAGANSLLSHILNRIAYIEIEPDPAAWLAWAFKAGIDPTLVAFAKLRPGTVFDDKPPVDDAPWCSGRSLHALSDLGTAVGGLRDLLMTSEDNRAMAQGLVGQAAIHELVSMIATADKLPDFDAIMKNPDTVKLPGTLDGKYLAVTLVALRAASHTDSSDEALRRNDEELRKAAAYLQRYEFNLTLVGIMGLLQRRPAVSKHVTQWIVKNQKLFGEYRMFM